MVCLNAKTPKARRFRTAALAVTCDLLLATLCLAVAQTSNGGKSDAGQKKVVLIVHTTDQLGNAVAPSSVKAAQVVEHGKKLQVVDGPKSAGAKQVALLLDFNSYQQKVMALEKRTAVELLSAFEKERAHTLVIGYGAEIHSSGELTDDWESLKNFTGSLAVDTDKHNETVLLYDAMKRAFEKLGDGPGTKAVVIFAEGNDHGSSIGWKSLTQLAHRANIACYVVLFADHSFYGTKGIRRYGWDLVELAPKTGGWLREVGDNRRKAGEVAQRIALALDTQSLIEVLVPDVHANRFHRVQVSSSGYRISAQTGYFDDAIQ